mmetsp:Transcript_77249/g.151532  ORF Transcript_77249/g.151532 Transcript_77249/m.151532 type:complete len:289 (+) Transcript_77249:90-956(+)
MAKRVVPPRLHDAAAAWLSTPVERHDDGLAERPAEPPQIGGNLHLLWGGVPDDGQSDETTRSVHTAGSSVEHEGMPDSSRRRRGAKPTLRRPVSSTSGGASHADSSETPRLVVDAADSSCSRESAAGVHTSQNHLVFPDDSTSDVSIDGRSATNSTEEPLAHGSGKARGTWPSVGSELHSSGTCKPCLFKHTAIGCSKGAACEFCHLGHRRSRATRPCKAKRERYKAIAEREAREAGILPKAGCWSESSAAGAGGQPRRGDDNGWAELVDDADEPPRRNARGKQILHL